MSLEQHLDIAFEPGKNIHMDRGTAVLLLVMFAIIVWCGYVFYDQQVHYWPSQQERQACNDKGGIILEGIPPHRCIHPEGLISDFQR